MRGQRSRHVTTLQALYGWPGPVWKACTVAAASYHERLFAPVLWWLIAAVMVASLGLAYAVATPGWVALTVTAVAAAVAVLVLVSYGSALVMVDADGVRAGRAVLPLNACGAVTVLSKNQFRDLRGPGADARAYLLLRPYVATAVRIDVADIADPTPYWLVCTRHPDRLDAAITEWRSPS
jgi:hypothetical protein